jgi:hypothetical protein
MLILITAEDKEILAQHHVRRRSMSLFALPKHLLHVLLTPHVLCKSILWALTIIAKISNKTWTSKPQPSSEQRNQTLNTIKKHHSTQFLFLILLGSYDTKKLSALS